VGVGDESTRTNLREGIDTAGQQLGEQIAADIPGTPTELRAQLPDRLAAVVDESVAAELSIDGVVAATPLDEYLDAAPPTADGGHDR
jgi:putative heme iron utilization protein